MPEALIESSLQAMWLLEQCCALNEEQESGVWHQQKYHPPREQLHDTDGQPVPGCYRTPPIVFADH